MTISTHNDEVGLAPFGLRGNSGTASLSTLTSRTSGSSWVAACSTIGTIVTGSLPRNQPAAECRCAAKLRQIADRRYAPRRPRVLREAQRWRMIRRLKSRLDRDQFFGNIGVTVGRHGDLRRKILTTVMGARHDGVQIVAGANYNRDDIMSANISRRRLGAGNILAFALLLLGDQRRWPNRSATNCFPSRMCGKPQPTARRRPISSTRRITSSGSARPDTTFGT